MTEKDGATLATNSQLHELPLYKTDAEVAQLIGVGRDKFGSVAKVWERSGFPKRDVAVGKRYWPAVKAWLDRRNGLGASYPAVARPLAPDGEEHWK